MQKEMYNYQKIREQIEADNREAERLRVLKEQEEKKKQSKTKLVTQAEDQSDNNADPFKDFPSEIEKVVSVEARNFI